MLRGDAMFDVNLARELFISRPVPALSLTTLSILTLVSFLAATQVLIYFLSDLSSQLDSEPMLPSSEPEPKVFGWVSYPTSTQLTLRIPRVVTLPDKQMPITIPQGLSQQLLETELSHHLLVHVYHTISWTNVYHNDSYSYVYHNTSWKDINPSKTCVYHCTSWTNVKCSNFCLDCYHNVFSTDMYYNSSWTNAPRTDTAMLLDRYQSEYLLDRCLSHGYPERCLSRYLLGRRLSHHLLDRYV